MKKIEQIYDEIEENIRKDIQELKILYSCLEDECKEYDEEDYKRIIDWNFEYVESVQEKEKYIMERIQQNINYDQEQFRRYEKEYRTAFEEYFNEEDYVYIITYANYVRNKRIQLKEKIQQARSLL